MFVLGIDPGLTRTGYAVVEISPHRERAVTAGLIRTDPGLGVAARLVELRADVMAVLDDHPIAIGTRTAIPTVASA